MTSECLAFKHFEVSDSKFKNTKCVRLALHVPVNHGQFPFLISFFSFVFDLNFERGYKEYKSASTEGNKMKIKTKKKKKERLRLRVVIKLVVIWNSGLRSDNDLHYTTQYTCDCHYIKSIKYYSFCVIYI